MNRIDLRLDRDFRLVMKSSTQIQIDNLRRELRKEKPGNIGLDMRSITWFGSVEAITPLHAKNWIDVEDEKVAFGLFQNYLKEIGNPTHIIILKESALKKVLIDNIVEERRVVYGTSDPLRANFGRNMGQYYEDWDLDALRRELNRIKEQRPEAVLA